MVRRNTFEFLHTSGNDFMERMLIHREEGRPFTGLRLRENRENKIRRISLTIETRYCDKEFYFYKRERRSNDVRNVISFSSNPNKNTDQTDSYNKVLFVRPVENKVFIMELRDGEVSEMEIIKAFLLFEVYITLLKK